MLIFINCWYNRFKVQGEPKVAVTPCYFKNSAGIGKPEYSGKVWVRWSIFYGMH